MFTTARVLSSISTAGWPCTLAPSLPLLPLGAARQSFCAGVQVSCAKWRDVMPMSPRKAPPVWCAMVATLAFQPNRPVIMLPEGASHTLLAWPLMGPGAAAWSAALARMSASAIASRRPTPIICGAMRGLLQCVRHAVGKLAFDRFVAQRDAPFRADALDGRVVELVSIHRVGLGPAMRVFAGDGQADQQGHGRVLGLAQAVEDRWRLAPAVLHMAATARARDEVRAQAITGLGGRGGLDPVAAKERVADDKARAFLIGQVGGWEREGIASGGEYGGLAAGFFAQRVGLGGRRQRWNAQAAEAGECDDDGAGSRQAHSALAAFGSRDLHVQGWTSVNLVMPMALAAATRSLLCCVRLSIVFWMRWRPGASLPPMISRSNGA